MNTPAIEQRHSNCGCEDWVGFVVKSGTPDAIIDTLNEATNKALAKASVR